MNEITEDWNKLHNKVPNVTLGIKSRRMRWVEHLARMKEGRVLTGFRWKT
jgi:hypothetical protein